MVCNISCRDNDPGALVPGLTVEDFSNEGGGRLLFSAEAGAPIPDPEPPLFRPLRRKVSEDTISLSQVVPQQADGAATAAVELVAFPMKLYALLQDSEAMGFENIVSWCCDGKAFKVHNRKIFFDWIAPKYFQQTKYKSFLRQLNLYGFERVSRGSHKGLCCHPSFIRGEPSLCSKIPRAQQIRRAASTSTNSSRRLSSNKLSSSRTRSSFSSGDDSSSGGAADDASCSYSAGEAASVGTTEESQQEPPREVPPCRSATAIECGLDVFGGKCFFPVEGSVLLKKKKAETSCDGLFLLLEGRAPADLVVASFPSSCSATTGSISDLDHRSPLEKIQAEAALPKRAGKNIRNDCFPWKLYDLLEDMESSGLNHIISWEDEGRAMKIHEPQAFVGVIIPYYFPQTKKLESFQRQLNLYGFKRTPRGPQKGFYTHENLVRGNRELCRHITRLP